MKRRVALPLLPPAALLLGAAVAVPPLVRVDERERDAMEDAAAELLEILDEEARERIRLAFDDPARLDWHYVPRERAGVALGAMSAGERIAAQRLVATALSHRGALKVHGVILLEEILGRDPGRYDVALFGVPGAEPWGWKLEGHHLSLNLTRASGRIAATPLFLGSQPALVRDGPNAGLRVLGGEEDAARALLASLDEAQREEGVRGGAVPDDVVLSPGRRGWLEPEGILVERMTDEQRRLVRALVDHVAGDLREDLADRARERFEDGFEGLRFLWIGAEEPGGRHYFRLADDRVAIEYDERAANHVHRVWRDRDRDFGRDLLRDHLERDHR